MTSAAIGALRAAPTMRKRQRDILIGREMIEQAEFLEHDADAPAQRAAVRAA